MRILITGSSGFVGKNLLNKLSKKHDHEIYITSREEVSLDYQKKQFIKHVFVTDNLFKESDEWLENICKNIDCIIHLAWYAKPKDYLTSEQNIECLIGSLSLAKAAKKLKVKRFISFGTCFEYEQSDLPLNTSSPLKPETLYASSKVSLFYNLKELFKDASTQFTWARIFFPYGIGEPREKLYTYLIENLKEEKPIMLSEGNQVRDFIHIDEAIRQIINIIDQNIHGPVNICTGQGMSVKDFVIMTTKNYNDKLLYLLNFGSKSPKIYDPKFVVGVPFTQQ